MFKFIGVTAVLAAGIGGVAYYQGWIGGRAEVSVTDKGRQALSDGLESTRQGISSGLQKAAESVKQSGTASSAKPQ